MIKVIEIIRGRLRTLGLAVQVLMVFQCSEEPKIAVPLVQTGSVVDVSADGATFTGLVNNVGGANASVGFVWGLNSGPLLSSAISYETSQFSRGTLEIRVTYDLIPGQLYYVRAFGHSGNNVVYGAEHVFTSQGSQQPVITNVSPTASQREGSFEILGKNFSPLATNNLVYLDQYPLTVLEASSTRLLVMIPGTFRLSGLLDLSVTVAEMKVVYSQKFLVAGPAITSFSPLTGYPGDTVRITGSGFSTAIDDNKITLGPFAAKVLMASVTELTVLIPQEITASITENFFLDISHITTSSPDKFSLLTSWSTVALGSVQPYARSYYISFTTPDYFYYGLGNSSQELWRYSLPGQSWERMADYPGAETYSCFGIDVNGKGLAGLGRSYNGSIPANKEVWEFDPSTNTWSQKSDFPGIPRVSPLGLSINGLAYIGLGSNSVPLKDFYRFDASSDTWTQLKDFPGTGGGVSESFTLNGFGYFVQSGQLWEYDPGTDAWIHRSAMPQSQSFPSALAIGSKVYFAGGSGSSGSAKSFWEYTPSTSVWTRRGDASVSLTAAASFRVGDLIYYYGGSTTSGYVNDFVVYDLIR